MTLSIRPVWLNKSIYLRVPNDLADLIEIDHQARVTLNFEEKGDRFLLIYSVQKEAVATPLTMSQQNAGDNNSVETLPRPKHGRIGA